MTIDVDVKVTGPLFDHRLDAAVDKYEKSTLAELAEEGARLVQAELYPGHGLLTGSYKRGIHGEVRDSIHGEVVDNNAIYGPWLEGVSKRNDRTRFRGYAMFRRGMQALDRKAEKIADENASKMAKELNG